MTTAVLDAFKEADVCIVNVPANMTKYYQPLDLTVNGYAKRYLKRKFVEWYSGQVKSQLDKNISIEDIQVGLQLTKLKPIHAGWLVEFYNHMTTTKGLSMVVGKLPESLMLLSSVQKRCHPSTPSVTSTQCWVMMTGKWMMIVI